MRYVKVNQGSGGITSVNRPWARIAHLIMNGRYYKLHRKWICGRESTLERRLIEDHLQINAWLKSIWRRRRLYSEFMATVVQILLSNGQLFRFDLVKVDSSQVPSRINNANRQTWQWDYAQWLPCILTQPEISKFVNEKPPKNFVSHNGVWVIPSSGQIQKQLQINNTKHW